MLKFEWKTSKKEENEVKNVCLIAFHLPKSFLPKIVKYFLNSKYVEFRLLDFEIVSQFCTFVCSTDDVTRAGVDNIIWPLESQTIEQIFNRCINYFSWSDDVVFCLFSLRRSFVIDSKNRCLIDCVRVALKWLWKHFSNCRRQHIWTLEKSNKSYEKKGAKKKIIENHF